MTSPPPVAALRSEVGASVDSIGVCRGDEQSRSSRGHGLQRSTGRLEITLNAAAGATRPFRMFQSGCGKLRFPRQHRGMEPTGVLINTAGGLTGGDTFTVDVSLGPGAAATLTTQAAEKIYRSAGGTACVDNKLYLEAGARLDWLPQETILFDRAALQRRTEVSMAEDATLTAVEMLIFGRTAMGERIAAADLSDQWRVRRGGRLVFVEANRITGPVSATLAAPAVAAAGIATALILHVDPNAESRLTMVRELLSQESAVQSGASAYDGLLVTRLVAEEGAALRSAVLCVLGGLRDGLPAPRSWMT